MSKKLGNLFFAVFLFTILLSLPIYTLAISPQEVTVKVLQTFLEDRGFLVIPEGDIKGNFGPLTKKALIEYQKSVGLPSQGIFGPLTKKRIAEELSQGEVEGAFQKSTDTVTISELNKKIEELKNYLLSQLSRLSAISSPTPSINYAQMALANRIDKLANTTIDTPIINGGSINNANINGGTLSGITVIDPSISGLTNLTLSGLLTGTDANFSGNVGIGTTTPTSRLQVTNGGAYISTLPAPIINSVNCSDSGGTLFASPYFFGITYLDANGLESAMSSELSGTVTTETGSCSITWTSVPDATSYRVYVGFITGGKVYWFPADSSSYTLDGFSGFSRVALEASGVSLKTVGDILTDGSINGIKFRTDDTESMFLGTGGVNNEGFLNTAIGFAALLGNTTGYANTAIGINSLYSNTEGSDNVAVGEWTLLGNLTGNENVAVGDSVLRGNTTGSYNSGLGGYALLWATGSNNTAVGYNAGHGVDGLSNISNNTLLGYFSGSSLRTGGNSNVFLGYNTGSTVTTGANNILIGVGVAPPTVTTSNFLNIGNAIYGNLSTGNIGIGTTTPAYKLTINSSNTTDNLFQVSTTTNQSIFVINNQGNVQIKNLGGTNTALLSVNDSGQLTRSGIFTRSALPKAGVPTVTVLGTPGSKTLRYATLGINEVGTGVGSDEVVITNAANTLNGTDRVKIDVPNVQGATMCAVRREDPTYELSWGLIWVGSCGTTIYDQGGESFEWSSSEFIEDKSVGIFTTSSQQVRLDNLKLGTITDSLLQQTGANQFSTSKSPLFIAKYGNDSSPAIEINTVTGPGGVDTSGGISVYAKTSTSTTYGYYLVEGVNAQATHQGSGTIGYAIRGGSFMAINSGSGIVPELIGVNSWPVITSGHVDRMVGTQALFSISGGTVDNVVGFYVDTSPWVTIPPGAVTNLYGMKIQPLDYGAKNYAVFTNQTASSTNATASYALYNIGTAPSYFGGSVGIGTTTPGQSLTVSGTVGFPGLTGGAGTAYLCTTLATGVISTSTTACNPSSQKLKDNIETMPDELGLTAIMQMRPVTFIYKPELLIPGSQIGFIAEEMYDIVPEVVGLDTNNLPNNIDYSKLAPIITKAIQELNLNVESLAGAISTTTPESTSFSQRFFSNLFAKLIQWFADAGNGIVKMFVGEINTKKVCVEDECLTKEDVKSLLGLIHEAGNTVINNSTDNSQTTTTDNGDIATTTDSSDVSTTTEKVIVPEVSNEIATTTTSEVVVEEVVPEITPDISTTE